MAIGASNAGPGDELREGPPDKPGAKVPDSPRRDARSRPTLLVNPPTDTRLRQELEAMLDEHAPATPAELQALVHAEYPRLVVRARQLEHESAVVWYVYREGYWVPATKDDAAGEAS